MDKKTVFVHLGYDAQANSLPPELWQEFEIHGLQEHQNPENEAIGFALEASDLHHSEWPDVVYTSLHKPEPGCCVTRHSLGIQPTT